jgi:hypothetical protein
MTDYLEIRNWDQFQHYRHRSPPWIKLHRDILASEDWVMLADASKLLMLVCMVVGARLDGRVPCDPHYLKRVAYLDKLPDLKPLIKCGFLIKPLADASTVLADASGCKQMQASARPEREERESKSREEKKGSTLSGANGKDPGFDALWDGWVPYKTPKGSRKKAYEKWTLHVARPGVDVELVLRSAAQYFIQSADSDCKTCHVSTWLTQERWIDDHDLIKNDEVTAQAIRMTAALRNLEDDPDDDQHNEPPLIEGTDQTLDP